MAINIIGKIEDHFAQIPNVVFRNPDLPPRAVVVLGNILTHTARYQLTVRTIAEQTGMSKTTVVTALKDLTERGYITRTEVPGAPGQFTSHDYTVNVWQILATAPNVDPEKVPTTPQDQPVPKSEPYQKLVQEPYQKLVQEPYQKLVHKEEQENTRGEEAAEASPTTLTLDQLAEQHARNKPPYPDHCPQHEHTPEPGPCRACQRTREHNEANRARAEHAHREIEKQRRAQAHTCPTCDHLGYRDTYNTKTGLVQQTKCNHTPQDAQDAQEATNHPTTPPEGYSPAQREEKPLNPTAEQFLQQLANRQ